MQAPEGAALIEMYTLAEKLGRMVAELMEMPAAELAGWRAYYAEKARRADAAVQ